MSLTKAVSAAGEASSPFKMPSTSDKSSTDDLAITQQEIIRLKKRRDLLLNTACNRHERGKLFQEVRSINRRLQVLHERMT